MPTMCPEVLAGELTAFLHDIHDAARAEAGIDATAVRDPSLADAAAHVAVREASRTVHLAIENGEGRETSAMVSTFGITILGTATIASPHLGSWDVTVTDLCEGKTVLREYGWTAGDPAAFSYRTGPWTQLRVTARWSEDEETVLELLVETNS